MGVASLRARSELEGKSIVSIVQRRFAKIVRASAEALLSIINDILDFSKIEAGKLQLEYASFDIEKMFDVLERDAEGRIEAASAAALALPEAALVRAGDKAYAWRVQGGALRKAALTLGARDARSGLWEVRSGLAAGDLVLRTVARRLQGCLRLGRMKDEGTAAVEITSLLKRNSAGIGAAQTELTQVQIERQTTLRDTRASVNALWLRLDSLEARDRSLGAAACALHPADAGRPLGAGDGRRAQPPPAPHLLRADRCHAGPARAGAAVRLPDRQGGPVRSAGGVPARRPATGSTSGSLVG